MVLQLSLSLHSEKLALLYMQAEKKMLKKYKSIIQLKCVLWV